MSNLIEDEIISIEKIEEHETMDIDVDGDHLFLANDILTHNSAYDQKAGLSLTQMSEAMKKVEHSDFVGLIRTTLDEIPTDSIQQQNKIFSDTGTMMIAIEKNRSGPKNKIVNLKTRFPIFRVDESVSGRDTNIPFDNPISNDPLSTC